MVRCMRSYSAGGGYSWVDILHGRNLNPPRWNTAANIRSV